MKCQRCDKEFDAKRSTKRFCSDACRQRNHRPNRIEKYDRLVNDYNRLLDDYNKLHAEATEICERANAHQDQLLSKIAMLELELKLLKDTGKSLDELANDTATHGDTRRQNQGVPTDA
jgi:hypothetical protein